MQEVSGPRPASCRLWVHVIGHTARGALNGNEGGNLVLGGRPSLPLGPVRRLGEGQEPRRACGDAHHGMGVIMPIEDEDLEIREILQSVEDALIDRGHDHYVVATEHGTFHWETVDRARAREAGKL
jgi:hypothetical protein